MRLDKNTGEWKKTAKEQENDQTKVNLEDKIQAQEDQIEMLTSMIGDILLGGGI